ncbi:uncharacterized protein LOC134777015 [Penaeus indicus]|uniref:uncharacterized protein LOC134777015 n=1 Tax=Penaeus indicus TaxID=29960 RepID=UPI00300D7D22
MLQRRQLREAALIALTVFLLLIGISWARHIDEDCIAFQRKEINVPGSSLNITSWNDSPGEKEFLTLNLYFTGKEFPDTYSILYVFPSRFQLAKFINSEPTKGNFTINPSLPNGWVDLQLKFEEKLEVWIAGFPGPLVREQNGFPVEKVELKGSNTTVNCRDDMVAWRVNHTRQVIPVAGPGSYRLTMYSGSPFTPKFISAEGELSIALEGKAYITGQGVPPLPPYKDHNFTLECNHSNSKINSCYLQAPGSDVIGPLVWSNSSITVSTEHGYFFLLLSQKIVAKAKEPTMGATEDSSEKATVTILVVMLTVTIITTTVFALLYVVAYQEKRGASNERHEDEVPLLQVKSRMWDAVNSNDVKLAKYLLENGVDPNAREGKQPTTALMEAHVLGRTEIVKLFLSNSGEKPTPPSNALVEECTEILHKRMKEVFTAAKSGMYDRQDGVHVKLRAHDFPATIRDHKGRSLVHCIANAKFDDERPCWEAADIRAFFDQEKPFPNAIDHWGQTALHFVASLTPRTPRARVVWGGRTRTVTEAWLEVARLLVEKGCDPRIKDHRGFLASKVARRSNNLKLAEFLEKESEARGAIDRKLAKSKFPDLVRATREGNTGRMMQLLMENVPILPMAAEEDPLKEALRYRRRDAVFLLLAAGAPLCNHYVSHLTSLEVSHHMVGQPALFPAIMRKAYVDRLTDEEKRARSSDHPIASFINELKTQVTNIGDEAHPKFEGDLAAKTEEAKKLLLEAAGLGLSLTCQMVSQEDVCFLQTSGEETPLDNALQKGHHDTAYALCRDLWMTPYICQNSQHAPAELLDDLKERDLVIFKLVCENKKCTYEKELCDQLKTSVAEGAPIEDEILDLALYWIAENGLTALLHERINDLNVNKEISKYSKTTMMHAAVLSGHRNVVEYLKYNGASFTETIGGFKVRDLAAMRQCKNCLMYICILEHDSDSWMCEYKKMKDSYEVPNVEPQALEYLRKDALSALSEPFPKDQAYEMLKKKGDMLKIKTFADLLSVAEEAKDKDFMRDFTEKVCEENDVILETLSKIDSRFAGKFSITGPLADGYEVTSFDTVYTNLEIKSSDAKDLHITITEDGKGLDIETTPSDFLNPQTFTKAFMSLMEKVVEKHTSSQRKQGLVLVPPFLLPSEDGVYLFWMWRRDKIRRFFRMNIRPVVEVKAPEHLERNLFKKRNTSKSVASTILISLMHERKYLYNSYTPTKLMIENLSNEERKTLYMCRFLTKMISFPWLYQRIQIHPLSSPWQEPNRIAELRTQVLDSLFLEELNETAQSDFKPGNIQERVRSILQRGTEKDSDGILVARKEICHLYNPSLLVSNTFQSIEGIIRYLDEFV